MRSVHDNFVYAYVVLCEEHRLILHTHYRDGGANEFTDIVFTGVQAHHFEGSLDSNILFDVEEVEPEWIVREFADLFAQQKKYGWPVIGCEEPELLARLLRERGAKGYVIHSSYGLGGWVLASEMSQVERTSAWIPV
jgi:hypothetical protein